MLSGELETRGLNAAVMKIRTVVVRANMAEGVDRRLKLMVRFVGTIG